MALTTADVLVETIADWGVEVVFGLPGDGINGIMEALGTRRDRIRFVQVRHEESAAFMACGYAKFTGKLGVCLATSGPGGIPRVPDRAGPARRRPPERARRRAGDEGGARAPPGGRRGAGAHRVAVDRPPTAGRPGCERRCHAPEVRGARRPRLIYPGVST